MNNLRKTEYFASKRFTYSQLEESIEDAKNKRDSFLSENNSKIQEIVHENIDFINLDINGSFIVISVITLSYYLKQNNYESTKAN